MKKKVESGPDIVGLIARIEAQLSVLDRKVDALMSRCSPQPVPVQVHAQAPARPAEPQKTRPMFPATCADCKQSCELPFKPGPDRPVYCKECFSRRKNRQAPMPVSSAPQVVHAAPVVEKSVPGKKKPAVAKKAVEKKKLVVKKKK